MSGEYELSGLAVPESLDQLHDLLQQVRRERPEIDESTVGMFEIAIVEIHGNVIQHGRPEGRVVYTFRLRVLDDRLVGVLADDGEPAPDLSQIHDLPSDDASESGRGLWLARATLDSLEYARRDGRNTWTLTRCIPA